MLRIVKFGDFSRAVSEDTSLKFKLAWISFGGLVLPTAFLMSTGLPAEYALPLMLLAIIPFQYLVFCFLRHDGSDPAPQTFRQISFPKFPQFEGASPIYRALPTQRMTESTFEIPQIKLTFLRAHEQETQSHSEAIDVKRLSREHRDAMIQIQKSSAQTAIEAPPRSGKLFPEFDRVGGRGPAFGSTATP